MPLASANRTTFTSRRQPGASIVTFDDLKEHPGNIFFVDSGATDATDSASFGQQPDQPFATLDFAIGQCTANQGDVIYVLPGHSETLTAAAQLVFDVAGIRVVGLGWGDTRPTFLLDAATTTDVDVSADDVWIENVRFGAGHADIVECIDLSGKRLTLKGCEFYDNAANENFVDYIKVTADNAADGLTVVGCRVVSPDTGNDGFINAGGDIDGLVFRDNYIRLGIQNNEPIIEVVGKSLTNCLIADNFFYRLNTDTSSGALLNSDQTDNSGIVARNVFAHRDTAAEVPIDLTGADAFENYATGVADASGYLLPTTDS